MDLSSVFGLIIGMALVIFGMVFDEGTGVIDWGAVGNFLSPASAAITFGGAIAATVISYPLSYFKKLGKHMRIITRKNPYKPQRYITTLVEFAQEARRKGLLSLEDKVKQEPDPFLRNCVMLIVDAIDPEKAKEMMENELNGLEERHSADWQFYEKFSTYGPAFGMIGTLIGLVNMLANLDMDSTGGATKMANGMAVALITTFYGSMLANMVLVPIGHRLHMCHNEEMVCKEIVVQGVIAIQAGDNPKHIEERLNAFLREKQRNQGASQSDSKSKRGKKAS